VQCTFFTSPVAFRPGGLGCSEHMAPCKYNPRFNERTWQKGFCIVCPLLIALRVPRLLRHLIVRRSPPHPPQSEIYLKKVRHARRTRKSCRIRNYLFHGSRVWEIVTGMEEQ